MLKEFNHRVSASSEIGIIFATEIIRQRLRYGSHKRCRCLLTALVKTRSSVGDTDEYFIDEPLARTR